MTPDTLAIRALNACRQLHKPTYVGLRSLLDSDGDQHRVQWATNIAAKKARKRTVPRYYSFKGLKEISEKGIPEYRDFIVGSPTTVLLEAYVLQLMADEPAFQVPTNVYSNLWPRSSKSGRSFHYYARGYSQRNSEIRSYLNGNPDYVAVVSDIRKFYPSVRWDDIEQRLQKRLSQVATKTTRIAIGNCSRALRNIHPKGIPIGPELAHVLGTIALEDVDRHLAERYGSSYFRYVDDIIILCPKSEAASTLATINQAVGASEFEIHQGKNDVVAAKTWVSECPVYGGRPNAESFEGLVEDICLLLAIRPKRAEDLWKRFQDNGIYLPLERMTSLARYGPFHGFLRGEGRRRGVLHTAKVFFRSDQAFVDLAMQLRQSLWSELESTADSIGPRQGMKRRWFVQQARYRINRLLYLTGPADYGKLRALVPAGAEFGEYRVLLDALRTGDLRELLRLPGRAVGAYCELQSLNSVKSVPSTFGDITDRAMSESAAALAIYFGWQPAIAEKPQTYEGSRILLEISMGVVSDVSRIERMSYLDELALLFQDLSSERIRTIARTRQFEGEAIGLEALGLGGGYGFS